MAIYDDETLMTGASGALAGSTFGPVGAGIGFAAGSLLGGSAKKARRKAELKILKANTRQAYDIGSNYYAESALNRESIDTEYTRSLGEARARFAGSGAPLEGDSWNSVVGSIANVRDEGYKQLGEYETAYKEGTAYEYLKQDYELATGTQVNTTRPGPKDDLPRVTTASIAGQGITGRSPYTADQQGMIKSYDDEGVASDRKFTAYEKYAEAVRPTFEEYETSQFGDDEARTLYEKDMTTRIESANKMYEQDWVVAHAADTAQAQFDQERRDREDSRGR